MTISLATKISIPTIVIASIAIIFLLSPSLASPWDDQIIQVGNINNATQSVIPCTYLVQQVQSGNPRTIQGINCLTGHIDYSSTNASNVFNNIMTAINTQGGGEVYTKGYGAIHPYNITTAIIIPNSGHLNFVGQGNEFTFLEIPAGSDNDMFLYTGIKSANSYFDYFSGFAMFGNDGVGGGGVHNDGFKFNSTSFGIQDSLFWNLFIEHFKQDDYFANQFSIWNMRINQDVIEYGGNTCINIAGDGTGAEMRITDSKIIFCNGMGIQIQATNNMQIIANWFYKNQKEDIKFIAGTSFSENIQNNNLQNSGLATTNTYYQMNLVGMAYSVVEGNNFNSAPSGNKPIGPILLGAGSVKDVIVNNNSFGTFTWGTSSAIKATNGLNNNIDIDNLGSNPYNKITNFVDGSTFSPFGTTGTIVNATTYTIDYSKALVTSTGGTGVSISLLDGSGNTLQSGLATLTEQQIPYGYQIKITFLTIPTVTVAFQ